MQWFFSSNDQPYSLFYIPYPSILNQNKLATVAWYFKCDCQLKNTGIPPYGNLTLLPF